MSKKTFGLKVRLGFDHVGYIMDLFHVAADKIKNSLMFRQITPEYKLTGIEIVDNKDFSYSIIFNFDNELSTEEILDKAITGGNQWIK